jgi:hypothetical protein
MAAPVTGDGAPAEGDAPTEDDRDEAEGEVDDSVGDGPEKTPTKKRNSRVHTVVSPNTSSAIFTTPSDSVSIRVTFDNWRLAAELGLKLIIGRTEFQNRGSKHKSALEFHRASSKWNNGYRKGELAVLLNGVVR